MKMCKISEVMRKVNYMVKFYCNVLLGSYKLIIILNKRFKERIRDIIE